MSAAGGSAVGALGGRALARDTVFAYSITNDEEPAMHPSDFRLLYRPAPDRLPRWVRRVWAWF